jgi:hypothetical protein
MKIKRREVFIEVFSEVLYHSRIEYLTDVKSNAIGYHVVIVLLYVVHLS